MIDAFCQEISAIILSLVQTNYLRNVEVFEDVDVACSRVAVPVDRVSLVDWSHKGQKFAWYDPVEIAIFNFFVMLIFASIKGLEVVPSESHCVFEALKAMQNGALILTRATTGISVVVQVGLVLLEDSEGGVGVHLEDDNHEGTHQVGRIRQLGKICRASVVVDPGRALEAVGLEQLLKLATESMCHSQVEGSEILVERHVGEVVVNVEEEGIVNVSRGRCISYPVQFV
jgi:hypothetical protein